MLRPCYRTNTRVRYTGKIQDDYARKHNALLSRQSDERQAQRLEQFVETRKVTFDDARQSLIDDMKGKLPERDFKLPPRRDVGEDFAEVAPHPDALPPEPGPVAPSRADEVKREM